MSNSEIKISPLPVIDPNLDIYGILISVLLLISTDRTAVLKAKDAYYKEQQIRAQEIVIIRDKLKWCYRREGVNHWQNCRHLSQQYMELMNELKAGSFIPFKLPPQTASEDS